ncbi:GIY-YIG nuclease family protein [Candidatus Saccharibacteria bacterium]|nr:GIY-YIG nuclease family protein [Candidatus Saccharibacteria bacterium]
MYFVYILSSKIKPRYYVGYTSDLKTRLAYHNRGANRSTRGLRPWELVYSERFKTKDDAWRREQQIKSYKGGRAFKALIESDSQGEVA